MEKTARYGPFFAENPLGLVVQKCHFDVTACTEARRLAQRTERSHGANLKFNIQFKMKSKIIILSVIHSIWEKLFKMVKITFKIRALASYLFCPYVFPFQICSLHIPCPTGSMKEIYFSRCSVVGSFVVMYKTLMERLIAESIFNVVFVIVSTTERCS